MFKSKLKDGKHAEEPKVSRKVTTTEKVERTGGVQTTTTTITCTKDKFDTAFKSLNLDPKKFHAGGTSVTRQIIYTNSDGHKEVIEETTETYEEPQHFETPRSMCISQPFSTSKSAADKVCDAKSSSNKESKTIVYKTGEFEKECLQAHNDYRKTHGTPVMSLSKALCVYAKEWADQLADTDSFEHRTEQKYGENIYMKWSSDPNHMVTGKEAVDSWYSEIKDHVFGREPRTSKSGHFTQVIWRESKELGVAWARSKSGKILVVANYDPPGNFVGKFSESVPPPKK